MFSEPIVISDDDEHVNSRLVELETLVEILQAEASIDKKKLAENAIVIQTLKTQLQSAKDEIKNDTIIQTLKTQFQSAKNEIRILNQHLKALLYATIPKIKYPKVSVCEPTQHLKYCTENLCHKLGILS